MRLSTKQKRAVLAACKELRPNARLVRAGDRWLVVWHVLYDELLDTMAPPKVPRDQRWRSQEVVRVEPNGVVWWAPEVHGATRRAVTHPQP